MLNWRDFECVKSGGAELATYEYMKHWRAQGHQVTLFTAGYGGAPAEELYDGIQIIRRGGPHTVHLWAFWYYVTRFRGRYDVVIDQIHGIPFFAFLYAGPKRVIAFIHEVAGDIWHRMYPFPLNYVGMAIENLGFRLHRRARFVTGSQSTADDLVRKGIARSQITIVPYGISAAPVSELPAKESEPTLLYVGRLCAMKGIDEALEAFALVNGRLPNAKFWIVGRGQESYVQQLEQMAADLQVAESVKFWGFVSEEDKLELMQRAHLLVHASVKEGWGLVVIEANRQGTPAVGYRVAGLADSIQHEQTGLLVASRDPANLAEAMVRVLKDDGYREDLSRNALEWSRQFTWERGAAAFLRVIEQAARRSSSHHGQSAEKAWGKQAALRKSQRPGP
jgi:glycosyltransferase involved in cell wall biosynthesis